MLNKFEQLVEKAKFDYKYIDSDFKFKPTESKGEIELVQLNKIMTSKEVMDKYELCSFEQLLEFAIKNPNAQKENPIFTLWKDHDGQLWYLILFGGDRDRRLNLFQVHPDDEWLDHYRAAVVRKSLDSGKLSPSEPLVSWPLDELIINGVKYRKV